jgi:hypothetical protein
MRYWDEKKEKLDKLEKKLYSRNVPNIIDKGRSEFGPKDSSQYEEEEKKEVKENWGESKAGGFDELASKVSQMAHKKHRFIRKIFYFSILFFLVALGAATFVFMGGINMVSSKNVDIKVNGPLSVGSGQEVSLDISVINNNNANLDSASLSVEYPQGTRSATDLSKELTVEKFDLGKISKGESYSQNIKAVFFGDKDTVKNLKITLEYKVENSSAVFYKEKTDELTISSAPVIITPTYPQEVNSNQEITFNIEVASNSKDDMKSFLVNVEYPFGFVFKSAAPAPSFNNNIWQIPALSSGEKQTISIKGNIIGQDNDEKVFKINSGTASADDQRIIGVPFGNLTESILVKKPFVGLQVLIGGKDADYAAKNGEKVPVKIVMNNNLPSKLFNSSVEVSLRGAALDPSQVSAMDGGFFQSSDNTILWDKRAVSEFESMDPGSEKDISFSVAPLMGGVTAGAKTGVVMTVTAKGDRMTDSGSSETVSTTETRTIALSSNVSLLSRIARSLGNLENSGPIPPKANTPTTYTVIWSVSNSFNQVSNVEVRATLPPYVKWTGQKSPQSELISYNQNTHEVVWNIGSMLPNTSQKQAYFQIEFTPSVSQVGQTPELMGTASLSGIDKVTGTKIQSTALGVTTSFSGDPTFNVGDDRVTQ